MCILENIDLLGIVTAAIALYIAYRQFKNDKYRIDIDLFDRRFEVYTSLGQIMSRLIAGLPDDSSPISSEIGRIERISLFLFSPEVQAEIKVICDESMELMKYYRELKPREKGGLPEGKERVDLAEKKGELFSTYVKKFTNLESVFNSQMNLTR